MSYEPKVLYNPTDKKVEFMCNGICYIFLPYEKKVVEGFPAYHALNHVNTGLVVYNIEEAAVAKEGMAYDKLPWKKLVALGSKEGVFKPGMPKEDLIKALEELDGQKA